MFKQVEPELARIAAKLIEDHLPMEGLHSHVTVSRMSVDRLQQAIADALYELRTGNKP